MYAQKDRVSEMLWRTVWRVARIGFGTACVGLGVAGLFLPFVQGILLIVIGLTVLSRESPHAHRLLIWLRGVVERRRGHVAAEVRKGADDAR